MATSEPLAAANSRWANHPIRRLHDSIRVDQQIHTARREIARLLRAHRAALAAGRAASAPAVREEFARETLRHAAAVRACRRVLAHLDARLRAITLTQPTNTRGLEIELRSVIESMDSHSNLPLPTLSPADSPQPQRDMA